jgi:enoyl-CoA hydratase
LSAAASPFGPVLGVVDHPGGVRLLTLNRPPRRNAIDRELFTELIAAIDELERDSRVRAAVITGAPPAFCAGVELADVADLALLAERRRTGVNPAGRLLAAATPVIAAVNGACVAGGLELALACDYILAAGEASFADPHVQLGLLPSWGSSALLPAAVGVRGARYLALSGEPICAEQAATMGLVAEVVPAEKLLDRALAQAMTIAAAPIDRVRELRRLYDLGEAADLDERLVLEREALMAGPVGAAEEGERQDG